MTEIESRLAQGKIDPVYFIGGDEGLLIQRAMAALVDAVVPPASRAFNHDVLDGRAGASAILNAARTLPMMGKRRLVVVRDADGLGADLSELAPYLAAPAPEAVLVLLFNKLDARMKVVQIAKKKGWLHQLDTPRQVAPFIREEAQRRGARMTEDGVRRLADVAGGDLGRIASAIEQLALYVGDGKPIDADAVEELIAETRERTIFELTNAVGDADRPRALRAVDRLFDQRESSIGVTMMLARTFRQIAVAKEAVEKGQGRDVARIAGVPPFAADALVSQSRRFSHAALARAIALLSQADQDLKSPVKAALGERIVVERLVDQLVSAATAPTRR